MHTLYGEKFTDQVGSTQTSPPGHYFKKITSSEFQHDQHARERVMEVGNTVMVRNLRPGEAWVPSNDSVQFRT